MGLPIELDHERLIKALDKQYPKIDIRNTRSPDFSLTERELFFKLGQRALVESLMDNLEKLKKGDRE